MFLILFSCFHNLITEKFVIIYLCTEYDHFYTQKLFNHVGIPNVYKNNVISLLTVGYNICRNENIMITIITRKKQVFFNA